MTTFSANLGFLWADRPLPDAIRAAKSAGFDAVECHWPYGTPAAAVKAALQETGLPMLGLNTRRGDVAGGENGLCALPGRETDALNAIAEAVEYGEHIGARCIHAMAGNATGTAAHDAFVRNLRVAVDMAARRNMTILIEPLNRFDAPDYFLRNTQQARDIIDEIGADNLKLMFDCYHVGRTEGDVSTCFTNHLEVIGHVQFASVPDRGAPDHGEVDYKAIFTQIGQAGWNTPLGAEYKPGGDTDETLGWLADFGSRSVH